MESLSNECRIILAIQALQKDPKLTVRKAAQIYGVSRMTITRRRAKKPSRRDIPANLRKMTDLEERVIVERILDLDTRGFSPRLENVREMANRLRAARDASPVGPRWAENFVKRQPELITRFRRPLDYQRAKCEDPEVCNAWFALVRNTIAKYGIQERDIYNFDETGFLMGMLSGAKVVTSSDRRGRPRTKQPGNREWVSVIHAVSTTGWVLPPYIIVKGKYHLLPWYENGQMPPEWRVHPSENGWTTNEIGLDWLKHFDKYTRSRTVGGYRLLILDGHESHHSLDFDDYCKEQNIITLCMPPHSSHILQPLDVGCFGPLKVAYGKAIEHLMRMQITHITKDDFFPAYVQAFYAAITEKNIKSGFRASGLVPHNPDEVISRLDIKSKTPTPPNSRPGTASSLPIQTPNTAYDADRQSALIKNKISRHQNSSPSHMYDIIDAQARGISKMAHELVLLRAELKDVQAANELLSKRRRAKRVRIKEGHLTHKKQKT
jgi:hypothetical protein